MLGLFLWSNIMFWKHHIPLLPEEGRPLDGVELLFKNHFLETDLRLPPFQGGESAGRGGASFSNFSL